MYTRASGPRSNRWALHEDSVGIEGAPELLELLNQVDEREPKLLEAVLEQYPGAWKARVVRTFRGFRRKGSVFYPVVQFCEAVVEQEWTRALPVLSRAGDPLRAHPDSQSPLACALQLGHLPMVGALLRLGVSLHERQGEPALMFFSASGIEAEKKAAQKLLELVPREQLDPWALCGGSTKALTLFEHHLKAGHWTLARALLDQPRPLPAFLQDSKRLWNAYTRAVVKATGDLGNYPARWLRYGEEIQAIAVQLSHHHPVPDALCKMALGQVNSLVQTPSQSSVYRPLLNTWSGFCRTLTPLPGVSQDMRDHWLQALMPQKALLDEGEVVFWNACLLDETTGAAQGGRGGRRL